MILFFHSVLVALFIGTIIWIIQSIIRPLTAKLFSQTWHYYTSLIPIFFLLGGTEIVSRLVPPIRSIFSSKMLSTNAEIINQIEPGQLIQSGIKSISNTGFNYLLLLETMGPIIQALMIIWVTGIVVFLFLNVQRYLVFKRRILKDSRKYTAALYPVDIRISPSATTPMAMGLWKPIIILPDTRIEQRKLAMILNHELIHVKRGDLLIKLLVLITNAIHWYYPPIYSLSRHINAYCELSCDEKVVQGMDMSDRKFYGETLLFMLEYGAMKRNIVCTNSLINPKSMLKRRLLNLMEMKKTKKTMLVVSIATAITLVGSGGTAAYAAGLTIPASKEIHGVNITVEYADGRVESFDKDGKRIPAQSKGSNKAKELTTEEIVDRIKKHIEKKLPIPQGYIDLLPQKTLDSLNKTYGLKLQKSK